MNVAFQTACAQQSIHFVTFFRQLVALEPVHVCHRLKLMIDEFGANAASVSTRLAVTVTTTATIQIRNVSIPNVLV